MPKFRVQKYSEAFLHPKNRLLRNERATSFWLGSDGDGSKGELDLRPDVHSVYPSIIVTKRRTLVAVAELKEEVMTFWVFFVLLATLLALQPKHEGKRCYSSRSSSRIKRNIPGPVRLLHPITGRFSREELPDRSTS